MELAQWLQKTYEGEGYLTQLLTIPGEAEGRGGVVLQIKEGYSEPWQETLSTVAGLDTAATVTLRREGEALHAEVGGGKWLDKAAVAGVATVISAGLLLLPAGIGAVKQGRLLKDLMLDLDRYVRTAQAGGSPTEAPAAPTPEPGDSSP